MDPLLDIINSSDVVGLIALIVLLCWIGSVMVRRNPTLGQWGWRLAAGAFILYCVLIGADVQQHTPYVWLGIVWRGVLAGGLILGVSWIVLGVYGFLQAMSDQAAAKARSRASVRKMERDRKQREKEERRRKEEWERQAPERERQQRLDEERRRQQEIVSAEAQRYRDDIRHACELVYNLHAPKIGTRFSKQEFRGFLKRYMNDEQPAEVIQRRADQLTETIQQHLEAVAPPEDFMSLDALGVWYAQNKAQVEKLEIDGSYKRTYLAQLHRRFHELSRQMLETLKP